MDCPQYRCPALEILGSDVAHTKRKVDRILTILEGPAEEPQSGMVTRLDRIEQTIVNAKWVVGMILGGLGTAIVGVCKLMFFASKP